MTAECMSCAYPITQENRKNVPSHVDCCKYCWRKVSPADRLRIAIACRDRMPGGCLSELAEVLMRTVDFQSKHDSE